jgi:hypothetical protein
MNISCVTNDTLLTTVACAYTGAEPSPQRSIFGSSGPIISPSSATGRAGPQEREVGRQRRRDSHESRRSNKLRFRSSLEKQSPSISEPGSSAAPDMSRSVNLVSMPLTSYSNEIRATYPSITYIAW